MFVFSPPSPSFSCLLLLQAAHNGIFSFGSPLLGAGTGAGLATEQIVFEKREKARWEAAAAAYAKEQEEIKKKQEAEGSKANDDASSNTSPPPPPVVIRIPTPLALPLPSDPYQFIMKICYWKEINGEKIGKTKRENTRTHTHVISIY